VPGDVPLEPLRLTAFTDVVNDVMTKRRLAMSHVFALHLDKVLEAAERAQAPWPLLLARWAVAGLWEDALKKDVLVAYEAGSHLLRVSAMTRSRKFPSQLFESLRASGAYMESGYEGVPVDGLRPLVRWEPPARMLALWPPGMRGETAAPRVIDAGSLVAYFSYPLAQHGTEADVRASGWDYAVVPTEILSRFRTNSRTYTHENSWAVILEE
jgi:hypothetical protein